MAERGDSNASRPAGDQTPTRAGMCLDSCTRFRSEVNALRYQSDFRAQITSSLVQISTTETRNGLRNRTLRRAFSRSGCAATGAICVQQFRWSAGLGFSTQTSKKRVIARHFHSNSTKSGCSRLPLGSWSSFRIAFKSAACASAIIALLFSFRL